MLSSCLVRCPLLLLQCSDRKLLHGDRRVEAKRIVRRALVRGVQQDALALLEGLRDMQRP